MNIYQVLSGEDDLAAVSIRGTDEDKESFRIALKSFESFVSSWKPFHAEIIGDPQSFPLGAFSPTDLVGGIFVASSAAFEPSIIATILNRDFEILPIIIEGEDAFICVCQHVIDGIDWERSRTRTLTNGVTIATRPVIREEAIDRPGFFRTTGSGTRLYLATNDRESFVEAYSSSGLRGLRFNRMQPTADREQDAGRQDLTRAESETP